MLYCIKRSKNFQINILLITLNILYRIPYPYFFSKHRSIGGHITHSCGIISGLVDEGHEVTVLAHEGKGTFEKLDAEFVRVRGSGSGMFWRQLWLRRFFKRSRKLLSTRTFDFSYTRYSIGAIPHLWRELKKESIPNVLEINTLGGQRLRLLKVVDPWVIRAATLPIVISVSLREWIQENLGSDVARRVQVIPNGVDGERFRPVQKKKSNGTFRCAFAGLLKPRYGLENAIEAARALSKDEISFHIFGTGPAEEELRELSRDVDNFVLEGEIPFGEVPDRLSKMDCLLYTTTPYFAYQSPTKLFEYMAVGRPIVAARTLQTEEILEGGELGRLFEIESSRSLVEAVRDVKSSYGAALERAEKAQQVAKEKHTWKSRVRRIVREVNEQ